MARRPAGRWATAVLVAAALCAGLAAPAWAEPSATTPTTGPGLATTTTSVTVPPATTIPSRTTVPVTPPTTGGTVPPPTTTSTAPGPSTTPVSTAQLGALLSSLNVDLARMSALQLFTSAQAAAALAAAGAPAAPVAATPIDDGLLQAAAAQLTTTRARDAVKVDVDSARRRLHELAVAYYVHDDVPANSAPASIVDTALPDRSVMLALLLAQGRHDFDTASQHLTVADKAQAAAKAHSDQLIASRVAAIQAAAQRAAAPVATTTTAAPTGPAGANPSPATSRPAASPNAVLGPTILGPSALNASELAAWFASTGHQVNITVPLATLTVLYQDNGKAFGVRDDIAFVQSIIETGYFSFPGGGQLNPSQNNFAGIGACDTCSTGRGFPDANTGVAAQLQLLHNYASAQPLPGPLGLNVGPTGCCPTWMSLTGVWATASTYGFSILTMYKHMLEWVLPRRAAGAGL